MRRKDREVTDSAKIQDVINRCTCCRIGFNDHGQVYIVPLNFGYEYVQDKYTLYFHGAKEGRKVDLIQSAPDVGFEMDTDYVLKTPDSDIACKCSARFQSVTGNGVVQMVTESEEKQHGLSLIMEHNTGKRDWIFEENMLRAVAVFKLEVTELSCKQHE